MSLPRLRDLLPQRRVLVAINDYGRGYKEFSKWLQQNAKRGTCVGIQLTEEEVSSKSTGHVMHSINRMIANLGLYAIPLAAEKSSTPEEMARTVLETIQKKQPAIAVVYDGTAAAIKSYLPGYRTKWVHKPGLIKRLKIRRTFNEHLLKHFNHPSSRRI